jgi:predicted nucleic acid-binding protein
VRVVIDTNVLAYALLGTPGFAGEALRLLAVTEGLLAPSVWEAEIANVVWVAARAGVIEATEAPDRLRQVVRFGVESVATRSLWQGSLARSVVSGVSVHDTLFVELAFRTDLPLVTHDARLLRTWPDRCIRPAALLH